MNIFYKMADMIGLNWQYPYMEEDETHAIDTLSLDQASDGSLHKENLNHPEESVKNLICHIDTMSDMGWMTSKQKEFVYVNLCKKIIEDIGTHRKDIYAESRANPYQHSLLTYKIGLLARCIGEINYHSEELGVIQNQLDSIYRSMLKIRRVAFAKLTPVAELNSKIALLLMTGTRTGFDSYQVDRLHALYYTYSQNDIWESNFKNRFGTIRQIPFGECASQQIEQNREAFEVIIATMISKYKPKRIKFEFLPMAHRFTYFSHEMIENYTSNESEFIQNCPRLQSIHVKNEKVLSQLPDAKNLRELEIENLTGDLNATLKAFVSCANIEILIDHCDSWRYIAFPEKLVKLTLKPSCKSIDIVPFLAKCSSLKSLELLCPISHATGGRPLLEILPSLKNLTSLRTQD